jgi:hypothetical protein
MAHVECGFAERRRRNMTDHLLLYRSIGAETRDDYLRMLAEENGLPLCVVERAADRLGNAEEFGALVAFCENTGGPLQ